MGKHAHKRDADGMYHIKGKKYQHLVGSRAQVGHENAYKTAGGLTRKDLHFNKRTGRWVSLLKSRTAKKENNLEKHGWKLASKGSFGATRRANKCVKSTRRANRKRRSTKN